MTRAFVLVALVIALVVFALGGIAPLASTAGFTWDAPAKASHHTPHGWHWR